MTAANRQLSEPPVLNQQARRLAIAHYYLHTLDAPPKKEWREEDGTISIIVRELKLPTGSRVNLWLWCLLV